MRCWLSRSKTPSGRLWLLLETKWQLLANNSLEESLWQLLALQSVQSQSSLASLSSTNRNPSHRMLLRVLTYQSKRNKTLKQLLNNNNSLLQNQLVHTIISSKIIANLLNSKTPHLMLLLLLTFQRRSISERKRAQSDATSPLSMRSSALAGTGDTRLPRRSRTRFA